MIDIVAVWPHGQEYYLPDHPEAKVRTHSPDLCGGTFCALHNPSDHPLKDKNMTLRLDKFVPIVERRCDHGIGHPDPDSIAYFASITEDEDVIRYIQMHGCDGCCHAGN